MPKKTENQPQTRAFQVDARLTGFLPKAGNPDSYEESKKANTIVLTLEVKLPAPTPPKSYTVWLNDWQRGGGSLKSSLERDLHSFVERKNKALEKQPKPKKGSHYFDPHEDTEEAPNDSLRGCKTCGQNAPGGVCLDPEDKARLEAAQAEVDELKAGMELKLHTAYEEYAEVQRNAMNKAFGATLSSGLFVAMLGQNVEVTLRPSSDLFQPMLDATWAVQQNMPALTVGRPTGEAD